MPLDSGRVVKVRFLGDVKDLEASLARAGVVAETSGKRIGDSFTAGTSRAAGGLHKLAAVGASWGVPLSGSLDKIGKQLDEAHTRTARFSTVMAAAGKTTLLAGTAGFAGAAIEATRLGEKFQTATTSIAANAGITQQAAQSLGRAFLDTAGKSVFSGQQMAAAYAGVAGQLRITQGHALSNAQAMRVMAAATDLAEATQTDLGTATAALAGVMQAYHLNVSQAAGASNVLFNTSKATGVGIGQVATAVERMHGRLGALAPSMKDVATVMVAFAQHGLSGSRALMAVNTAFQTLVSPTKKVQEVLKALGANIYDSSGRFVGMAGAIAQLRPHLVGLTQQQQIFVAQTLFGKSAGQAMLAVIRSGVPAYDAARAAVEKHNAVQNAATAQSKTLHGEIERLKATVQDLGTKFGLFLIPKLQATGQAIANVVQWFGRHKVAAEALAAVITGALGAAVGAFVATKAVAMVNGIKNMVSSFGALATRIGVTAGVVATEDAAMVASTDAAAASIDAALIGTGVGAALVALGLAATQLQGHWTQVWAALQSATVAAANAVITYGINPIIDSIDKMIAKYNLLFGWLTGNIGKLNKLGAVALGGGNGGGIGQTVLTGPNAGAGVIYNPTGLPHLTPGPTTGPGSNAYFNPLPGRTSTGRTDMGVDFSATPGSAVRAIGTGVIDAIIRNWYHGQPLVEERLTRGPRRGQYVYYAEQINPNVSTGQVVSAGQRIGSVAASGTGLELGFGAGGGRTLAQATTGYREGQVTPAGRAFLAFINSLGGGGGGGGGGGSVNSGLSALINPPAAHHRTAAQRAHDRALARLHALINISNGLLAKLSNAIQSGTAKTLMAALGVSTGGRVSATLHRVIEGVPATAGVGGIEAALLPTLTRAAHGSVQDKAFNADVAALRKDGQRDLANRLVAAHKQAMQALAEEMYAQQATKDAESLNLEATKLRDQTQLEANHNQSMLDIARAQQQKVVDAMEAQVTIIRDWTQIVTDQFSGMVQRIEDATQAMSDANNAVVQGINDQTQIRVDILGERGLYGLNLIAQRLQVQADITKAFWDQQIAIARQNLDGVTAQWHAAVQNAQINLDHVQLAQDTLVAQEQQADDTVHIAQLGRIAAAQAHYDALVLHDDTTVIGPAQIAVDMNATAPKAVQDVMAAQLKKAQGTVGKGEAAAAGALAAITASANTLIFNADSALTITQTTAASLIASAQQALATTQGEAGVAIATATQALTGVEGQAGVAEAGASGAASIAGAQASTQFAGGGVVVNMYGIPVENASAVGQAFDWLARNTLGLST